MSGVFVGSVGETISFTGTIDFTGFDVVELELERPNGSTFTMTATPDATDGKILTATTATNQFTTHGSYHVWGHGKMNDGTANRRTGIGTLEVYRIGEGVTP